MKIHTTLSIDEELLKKARDRGLNLSRELEKALKTFFISKVSDMPEDCVIIMCHKCNKAIREGFFCREGKRAYCKDCQESVVCPTGYNDNNGEHGHIYFDLDEKEHNKEHKALEKMEKHVQL